jgi:hypothetical protein
MRLRTPRTPPVPVVLPRVQVWIDLTDRLAVTVDREPYDIPDNVIPAGRPALARILDEITTRLASPVRVEVHEADGAVFTDIITPRPTATTEMHEPGQAQPVTRPLHHAFAPGEEIVVAVVVSHATADHTGSAQVRLPAALMAKHHGAVLLLGRTSGTVAFPADTSTTGGHPGSAGVA